MGLLTYRSVLRSTMPSCVQHSRASTCSIGASSRGSASSRSSTARSAFIGPATPPSLAPKAGLGIFETYAAQGLLKWFGCVILALNRAAIVEPAAHAQVLGHVHTAVNDQAGATHLHTGVNDATGSSAYAIGSCQPTSAQSHAAIRQATDNRRGLARFVHLRDARAAGYLPHWRGREAIKHSFNPGYVTDGRVLDPGRPEGLLYAFTARGPVVVAAVYLMNRAGEPGGAVGGCPTPWHVHDNLCSSDPDRGMITGLLSRDGHARAAR